MLAVSLVWIFSLPTIFNLSAEPESQQEKLLYAGNRACVVSEWVLSKFNGTSTPKRSYRAKTGDNDYNVNSIHYSLSTALCESIRYQAKSEQNVWQDLIPRVGHGEAALCMQTHNGYVLEMCDCV